MGAGGTTSAKGYKWVFIRQTPRTIDGDHYRVGVTKNNPTGKDKDDNGNPVTKDTAGATLVEGDSEDGKDHAIRVFNYGLTTVPNETVLTFKDIQDMVAEYHKANLDIIKTKKATGEKDGQPFSKDVSITIAADEQELLKAMARGLRDGTGLATVQACERAIQDKYGKAAGPKGRAQDTSIDLDSES